MISDEMIWLDALHAGNNVSHSYNREIALDIIQQTKEKFYELFCVLKKNIDENWL